MTDYIKKTYILFIIIVIFSIIVDAQTYYGKNLFGRLQTINDSINTVAFISMGDYYPIDSCSIRKHKDTVFLSTKEQWKYKVNVFDEIKTHPYVRLSSVVKIYQYSFHDKKYKYSEDIVGIYDTITKLIVIEEVKFGREQCIIAYKDFDGVYHRVKHYFDKESCYLALEKNPDYAQGVIFNEFPLLIKGNKLIPINKEKQMQCWLDNGFFFPKMKMSKKDKKYHVINGHYIGLRNLPTKMDGLEKLNSLPRRYMKYLEN